jgi:hypothetical protein
LFPKQVIFAQCWELISAHYDEGDALTLQKSQAYDRICPCVCFGKDNIGMFYLRCFVEFL